MKPFPKLLACAALGVGAALALRGADGTAPADPPRRFRIPSLYHVGFWIRDLAKTRAFYRDFLGYEEPYSLNFPNGKLQLVIMKVNERQVIYLFPNAAKILPNGDNLDHLGLETDDAAALYAYLLAKGIKVAPPKRGRIGDLLLGVRDPDGHPYEVTQFEPEGQLRRHAGLSLAAGRISSHLRSISISVADPAASRRFYVDILGFRELARNGGPVRLQVPDGTDYLVLVPSDGRARAVPEYRLEVPDAAQAAAILAPRAAAAGLPPPAPPTIGPDGRLQTSCVDPDGTRVVLSE
jgi:lactoylglutathione lyase